MTTRMTPYGERLAILAFAFALLVAVAGCQSTGEMQPNRAIGTALTAVQTVAESATALHAQGLIPDSKALEIADRLEQAVALLDVAQNSMEEGDQAAMDRALATVDNVLATVQLMMAEAGAAQ